MKKLIVFMIGLLLIGLAIADPTPMKIVGSLVFMGCMSVFFSFKPSSVLGAAGDFTKAELLVIQGLVESYWADNTIQKDYVAHVDSVLAVRNSQTARLADLQGQKDRTINLIWVKDCEDALADCDDDCVIGGSELEAESQEYTLDLCKTVGFNVKEKAFRTLQLEREEVVAKGFMSRMKQLDEWLAGQLIGKLNTFAGVNQYQGGVFGGASYNEAAPEYWDANLFGEFDIIAQLNQFANPYLLSGTNLRKEFWNAQMVAANSNEKDKLNKFQTMSTVFDLWNIDTQNTPDKVTYMLDRGAVAVVTKNYYGSTPIQYIGAGQTRYSVPSMNIPGVTYDVVYTNECVSNEITHKFSVYVNAGIFLNPLGCSADNTGVLQFFCGTQSGS